MKNDVKKEDIELKCQRLKGHSLREYLKFNDEISWEDATCSIFGDKEKNSRNKGSYGNFIQEKIFDIPINSVSEPDFSNLGIELKVVPIKKSISNGETYYYPKERVSLSEINFHNIINEPSFSDSKFYNKIKHILFIYYIYKNDSDKLDYMILDYKFFELSKSKYNQNVERDYYTIYSEIMNGNAHNLSESMTNYLGAATTGKKGNNLVSQPNSDKLAKKRRFSFKPKFISNVLLTGSNDDSELEKIYIKIKAEIKKLKNCTLSNILGSDFKENSKNNKFDAIKKILNIEKYNEIDGLVENSIKIKNIEINGKSIKEEIPLIDISIDDFINEYEFYDSEFAQYLMTFKIIFIIWEWKKDINDCILIGTHEFKFDYQSLAYAEKVYNDTKNKFLNGMVLTKKINAKNKVTINTNLIKITDNLHFHVRPHAIDGTNTMTTPFGQTITKSAFWLNKKILYEKIKEQLKK